MALYLVQHGISAPREVDQEKGLSEQGKEATLRIAAVAKGYGITVHKIVHSGKKRAAQTAAIFHQALAPESSIEVLSGINPLDDVRPVAAQLDPQKGWLIVGHLPFMERLLSHLTTGSEDIRVYRFQNSGIVCLDAEIEPQKGLDWFIRWTLNPSIT